MSKSLISGATISAVKDLSITEVITKYGVELKKKGVNHWACCPFHGEKTPSFAVSFAKQTFSCYGCHEYGNGVDFVMKLKNLEFPEAISEIANEFGIPIEHDSSQQAQDNARAAAKKRELAEITKIAFKFLKENQQPLAVADIGYYDEIIKSFHVMHSLEGWTTLTDHLKKQNVDLEAAAKLKLVTKVQNGPNKGNFIDVLRNCVIFPIHDQRGRVLGFAKRHINPEDVENFGKWHNPAENDLYKKRFSLFGIYQAMEAMEATGQAWLVEGYTDVTSMFLAGFNNTIASSGTALTIEQAKLIAKYAKHVNILRDGDSAGQKAMERDIEILLTVGLTCSIVTLPKKHDPDSLILNHQTA